MIALMTYTFVTSLALTGAALATERAFRLWRRQARVVWGIAMALSIVLPAVSVGQSLAWLPRLDNVTGFAAALSASAIAVARYSCSAPPAATNRCAP